MFSKNTSRFHPPKGYTLIELSLIIAVLLLMTSVLFIGINGYREGSDRAFCIQQIASVQKAVRSFANLYALDEGETYPNLHDQIIGPDRFFEVEPACPAGGIYIFGGNIIPPLSVPYLKCGILEHEPTTTSTW